MSIEPDDLIPLVDDGLGNSTYLLDLGDGRALAVDPPRDLRALRTAADRRGLRVAYAADTHLHAELDRLTDGQEVVAYCRGPYCVYADDAVRELRRRGIPARRLEDGYPEWADARLPTATG